MAVLSGFHDEEFAFAEDEPDEAFVAEKIPPFCVSVRQAALGELSQAPILALCNILKTMMSYTYV